MEVTVSEFTRKSRFKRSRAFPRCHKRHSQGVQAHGRFRIYQDGPCWFQRTTNGWIVMEDNYALFLSHGYTVRSISPSIILYIRPYLPAPVAAQMRRVSRTWKFFSIVELDWEVICWKRNGAVVSSWWGIYTQAHSHYRFSY
jgi:hypothetical protein